MQKFLKFTLLACTVLGAVRPAYALYGVIETGAWPESWPKELEPLRNQSCTLTHETAEIHIIPFTNRAEFEAAWPHILAIKSQGAPITLLSAPDKRYPDAKRPQPTKACVYVLTPLTETLVTPEGTRYPPGAEASIRDGKFLRIGPPWPDDIKSASGVLPEYVVYQDGKWAAYTEGQPKDRHLRRARTDIELLVDGNIIDWKPSPLPADTPLIDKRLASSESTTKPVPNVVVGQVTDPTGKPLGDVRWLIGASERWRNGQWQLDGPKLGIFVIGWPASVTDAEGRFELKFPDNARYDLQFYKEGYAPAFLYQVGLEKQALQVVLKEGVPVRGLIVSKDAQAWPGDPTARPLVKLRFPSRDFWFETSTRVDVEGRFEFPHVGPPTKAPGWSKPAQWQIVCLGKVVPIDVAEGKPAEVRIEISQADIERDYRERGGRIATGP